jgi:hypothetical protein
VELFASGAEYFASASREFFDGVWEYLVSEGKLPNLSDMLGDEIFAAFIDGLEE